MPGPDEDAGTETSKKKPLSFWLSFVALNITVFIVSLDSTALAVAVPVMLPIQTCRVRRLGETTANDSAMCSE